MRSRIWSAILLVSSAAACAPIAPQSAPSPRLAVAEADVPPILSLVSERERLSLTPAQVNALDSIAREWDVANEKLVRRLRLARGTRPIPLVAALRPEGSTARERLIDNNRRAALAVERVLTPAQRTAACANSTLAQRGKPASTKPLDKRSRVWPWCGAGDAAQPLAARAVGD